MNLKKTEIPGVMVLEPRVFTDSRGFFFESWNERTFQQLELDMHFVQDNHSHSESGTLRGLHYQISRPQGKLVRVIRGAVFDVAVDLRRSSATFGRWVGRELSADNKRMLWIPPGCAHGFYALSDADFFYKCTAYYDAEDEHTIRWNDPELAIDWPLAGDRPPLVSEKDKAGTSLGEAETYP